MYTESGLYLTTITTITKRKRRSMIKIVSRNTTTLTGLGPTHHTPHTPMLILFTTRWMDIKHCRRLYEAKNTDQATVYLIPGKEMPTLKTKIQKD